MKGNLFKYKKALWKFELNNWGEEYVDGPFCSAEGCRFPLAYITENSAICNECKKQYSFDVGLDQLKVKFNQKYESMERLSVEVTSLDLPPTNVGAEAEDENYWISARIGQKNGKKFGVVYLGEKKKSQSAKEKTQFFIDLDDEEVRHDPNNMSPGDILAGIKVKFKDSIMGTKYDK
jgi:hypothetical protein